MSDTGYVGVNCKWIEDLLKKGIRRIVKTFEKVEWQGLYFRWERFCMPDIGYVGVSCKRIEDLLKEEKRCEGLWKLSRKSNGGCIFDELGYSLCRVYICEMNIREDTFACIRRVMRDWATIDGTHARLSLQSWTWKKNFHWCSDITLTFAIVCSVTSLHKR